MEKPLPSNAMLMRALCPVSPRATKIEVHLGHLLRGRLQVQVHAHDLRLLLGRPPRCLPPRAPRPASCGSARQSVRDEPVAQVDGVQVLALADCRRHPIHGEHPGLPQQPARSGSPRGSVARPRHRAQVVLQRVGGHSRRAVHREGHDAAVVAPLSTLRRAQCVRGVPAYLAPKRAASR